MKYEYPGYTGEEKWAIITGLTEEELNEKYAEKTASLRPFIRTGYILSLCPKCRSEFFSVPENILRRVDPLQVEKEPCDKCQVGYGYDYLITKRTKHIRDNGGGFDV